MVKEIIKRILFLFGFILFLSCSNNSKISAFIKKTNKNSVELQEFVTSKIDCIYIFGEYTDDNDISEIIGSKYESPIIHDSQYLLLILSNKEVVYSEIFNEKEFEFSRSNVKIFNGINYRKYSSSTFKILKLSNNIKRLIPVDNG